MDTPVRKQYLQLGSYLIFVLVLPDETKYRSASQLLLGNAPDFIDGHCSPFTSYASFSFCDQPSAYTFILLQGLTPDVVVSFFNALQNGLEDYSMDERGDVGSWIRMACIQGLTSFSEILISNASNIPAFEEYLPESRYQSAIGGILRQGVERLDNVRQEAGECFLRLLRLPRPSVAKAERWDIKGQSLMKQLFLR